MSIGDVLVRGSVRTALAATTLVALCGIASATPVTSWQFDNSVLQHGAYDPEGGFPIIVNYDGISPNIVGESTENGMHMYSPGDGSTTFSLTGESYIGTPPLPTRGESTVLRGNRLGMYGTGTIDGAAWQHPEDIIRTTFGFGFEFSGGSLTLYTVGTFFTLTDSENNFITGVGSGTGFDPFEPGGYGLGFAFEDRFGADIHTATNIFWGVEIYFDWTGYSPDDTLSFNIPSNSIDINAMTTPTPGAAGLAGLAGLVAIRRRRA